MAWLTYLAILNSIAGVLLVELLVFRRHQTVINVDEARDARWPAFRRLDTHNWKRWRIYPGAMTMMLPRVILFFVGDPLMIFIIT